MSCERARARGAKRPGSCGWGGCLAHDVLTHIEAVQKFTRCNPTDVHKKASITVPGDLKTGPFSSHDSPEHLAIVVELLVVAPVLAVLVEVVVAHAVLVVVEVLLVLVRVGVRVGVRVRVRLGFLGLGLRLGLGLG